MPRDPGPADVSEAQGATRAESHGGDARRGYWDPTDSGRHLISRPIAIDGLRAERARIELAPRIARRGSVFVDDSYNAVDVAARQLASAFTLEQLVMSTVALRVHMRRGREHVERKKALQERWTALAHRLMKLRAEERHDALREQRLADERSAFASASEAPPGGAELLALQAAELAQARERLQADTARAWEAWSRLEEEEAEMLGQAPRLEQTEDLRQPYILLLVRARRSAPRSVAAAMYTLVDALQRPLSRTDQMLLEIAFRRCIRAAAPEGEREVERWEASLLAAAEREFAAEFAWAAPYLGSG